MKEGRRRREGKEEGRRRMEDERERRDEGRETKERREGGEKMKDGRRKREPAGVSAVHQGARCPLNSDAANRGRPVPVIFF